MGLRDLINDLDKANALADAIGRIAENGERLEKLGVRVASRKTSVGPGQPGPPWRGNTGPSITPPPDNFKPPPPDNFKPPLGNAGTADLGPASSQPPQSASDPRWGQQFPGWIWTGYGYRRDFGKPPESAGPRPGDAIPGATWNPITQRYTIDRQPGQLYLPAGAGGPLAPRTPFGGGYVGIGTPGGPSNGYVGIGTPGGPAGDMVSSSSSGGGGGGGRNGRPVPYPTTIFAGATDGALPGDMGKLLDATNSVNQTLGQIAQTLANPKPSTGEKAIIEELRAIRRTAAGDGGVSTRAKGGM
jgi:hypothetical protein